MANSNEDDNCGYGKQQARTEEEEEEEKIMRIVFFISQRFSRWVCYEKTSDAKLRERMSEGTGKQSNSEKKEEKWRKKLKTQLEMDELKWIECHVDANDVEMATKQNETKRRNLVEQFIKIIWLFV